MFVSSIRMLFNFIQSKAFSGILCILLIAGLVFWLFDCPVWKTEDSTVSAAQKEIQNSIAKLERRYPIAAAELAKLRETHNVIALAATLKERQQIQGLDGLERLANYRSNSYGDYDLRLADFAMSQKFINQEQRSDFILTHGIALQQQDSMIKTMNLNLNDMGIDGYFHTLENASHDEKQWSRVRENPIMLFLQQQVTDPSLLDFYQAEKDWLDTVLFLILCNSETEGENGKAESSTAESVLNTIRINHPYFKDAVTSSLSSPENEVKATVLNTYAMFVNYGKVFRYCIETGLIPTQELLDIVYANPDYFDKHVNDAPDKLAATLINIQKSHPAVWKAAMQSPLCLQLYETVPNLANSLCDKYGDYDIATFLFLKYDGLVPQAAAAIDKFGETAIITLSQYELSTSFRKALGDNQLGVRIIPYVMMFGDEGLTKIDANRNWLDKYFDEEGNPKESEWWTYLPGGGAAKVAKNMASGYPNDWGELGWAAVDVADATLLIVTLGSSAPVSATKSGATTSAKVGSKLVAKEVVKEVAEKTALKAAAKGESKSLARKEATSLFRLSARLAKPLRLSIHTVGTGTRIILKTADTAIHVAGIVGSKVYSAVRTIDRTWTGMSVAKRQMICRSLFYVGMTATIIYRTLPMAAKQIGKLSELGEKFGEGLAKMIKEIAKSVPAVLNGFLNEMLGSTGKTAFGDYVRYSLVSLLLVAGIVCLGRRLFRTPKRTHATA